MTRRLSLTAMTGGVVIGGAVATILLTLLATKDPKIVLLPVVVIIGTVVYRLTVEFGSGFLLGLSILGGLNILPGPDLSTAVHNSITGQDLVFGLLVLLLLRANMRAASRPLWSHHVGVLLASWVAVFLLYYAFTLVRTWFGTPVPLVHAITYSRGYLYFVVLVPLFVRPLQDPTVRRTVFWVCGIGGGISCLAQIVAVLSRVDLGILLHVDYTSGAETLGLTRIRGSSGAVPFTLVPFGYALALFSRDRRQSCIGVGLTVLGLTAVALGLTRTIYAGTLSGLLTVTLVGTLIAGRGGDLARRRLVVATLVIGVVGFGLYAILPSTLARTPLAAVGQRLSSLVDVATGQTVNDAAVATRNDETRSIEYAIGSHWLLGLGELDPQYDYVGIGGVPQGAIGNIDVELVAGVAMIGVVGLTIYFLPVLVLLGYLVVAIAGGQRDRGREWMLVAGVGWGVGVLVAAPTIGLTANPSTVIGSAAVFSLLVGMLYDPAA